MLSAADMQAVGLRSADAVRAYEGELLAMMAAELAAADLEGDPYGALPDVARKASRIAARHRPLILDAIRADMRDALSQSEQGDDDAAENAAQAILGG